MAGRTPSSDASQPLTADDTDVSTPKSKVHEGIWNSWSYEFLALTISAISFLCLVATLHVFDGQRQQEWSYRHVTRNTVIAAISTITRAPLLATVAVSLSQNKWTWFSTSHRRGRKLQELEIFDNASRGASGSLQLLKAVKHNHIASLGALVTILALGFDTFAQNILGLENHAVPRPDPIGAIPRSEVYNASNKMQDWFNYDLNFDMKAGISNGLLGGYTSIPPPTCSTGNCTWPVVPSLATVSNLSDVAQSLFNVSSTPYGHVYSDVLGKPGRIYTARFSVINTWISDVTPDDNLLATECALWFCMRAYDTSINSGLEDEMLKSEWDVATPLDPLQISSLVSEGGRNFTNTPSEFNTDDAMVFGTTYDTVKAINATIAQQIAGNVTWSGHFGAFHYSSDKTESLWNARKDLDAWTKNISLAMTSVIRISGTIMNLDESNSKYARKTTSTETFIQVRWMWLIYPAAMLLLGCLHFMVTIRQISKCATFTWKGTPIVPLLLTVESDDGGIECIHSDGQLLKEVRDRRVILRQENEKGWYFGNAM